MTMIRCNWGPPSGHKWWLCTKISLYLPTITAFFPNGDVILQLYNDVGLREMNGLAHNVNDVITSCKIVNDLMLSFNWPDFVCFHMFFCFVVRKNDLQRKEELCAFIPS